MKTGLLSKLFGWPKLDENVAAAIQEWRKLPAPGGDTPMDTGRFVVVDVESSGMDVYRDRLISIGAVAVRGGRVEYGDSFEVILQQETVSDTQNILVHGIGGMAQALGAPPGEALADFLKYVGKDPLIAFHVAFDETMIKRAMKKYLGVSFRQRWIDLAYVAPALWPELARKHHDLDDWMECFGLTNYLRHNAVSDALTTAQLFLVALSRAMQTGAATADDWKELEEAHRWLEWTI